MRAYPEISFTPAISVCIPRRIADGEEMIVWAFKFNQGIRTDVWYLAVMNSQFQGNDASLRRDSRCRRRLP